MNAVITGATKGIGKAITDMLTEKGFNVAICSRNESDLISFQSELLSKHPNIKVLYKATDVSKKAEVFAFAEMIKSEWGKIDILVNNAGVFTPGATHLEADGTLEQMIETNLYSAYHLTRQLLPVMLPHQSGHVFNMCSIASVMAYPNGGSYSISKFALLGFSKVLRAELSDKGIRVTAILPGATWSASWAGANFPDERLMKAEDVAKALWGAFEMSKQSVVEEILIRPQLGDL